MTPTLASLEAKKRQLDNHRPFSQDIVKNLNDWLTVELTYTSNAIEGNTLSRAETALVIEKGLTVSGKTIQEHLEAINHARAFVWVLKQSTIPNFLVSERTILDIHEHILKKIDDTNAGRYRTVAVRIAGSPVVLPNAMKVPELMSALASWLQKPTLHPIERAVDAHLTLVSIHPFVDGNGRTARLLMNLLLMMAGYPPCIIRKEERTRYISSIEKIQLGGSHGTYEACLYEAIDRSLDMYLETLEPKKEQKTNTTNLLKIGDLARMTDETVSTIRHWTKEGLLPVTKHTKGGYQLYNNTMVQRAKQIRSLQDTKRLTLEEIRKALE